MTYVRALLGIGSIITLGLIQASAVVPLEIVPAINLVAIIAGSISMGMLFNRVKQLERRMDKVQDKIFER